MGNKSGGSRSIQRGAAGRALLPGGLSEQDQEVIVMRVRGKFGHLLASGAALAVVTGAQGADLPLKAKPVQYVKICTLYGEGYYYIPGTDTCIKFGGYVRADFGFNGTGARNPQYSGTAGAQDRTVSPFSTRHRARIAIDTRTQTQYGVVRTLTGLQFQNQDQTESFNVARAFIQWAGFTFGRTKSFSDTWSIDGSWAYTTQQNQSDSGANGVNEAAYTFDLGHGTSLTFGADERRTKSLTNLSNPGAIRVGAEPNNSFAGESWPDLHADFHVDEPWGFWRSTVLAHNVDATYYTSTGARGACPNPGGLGPTGIPLTTCGHPSDRVGWVAMTGGEFKLPMLGTGDRMGYMAHYGRGTSAYSGGGTLSSADLFASGNQLAVGWITDGTYVNGSQIELTTTWSVGAGYEHYWTPTVHTALTGVYTRIGYDTTAKGFFATNVCSKGGQVGFNTLAGDCDPDWAFFQGSIKTEWNPVPDLILGVDTTYTRVFTAFNGATASLAGINTSATTGAVTPVNPVVGARPAGAYSFGDQATWLFMFRAQRNFNTGG
jgi:Porin subfamily